MSAKLSQALTRRSTVTLTHEGQTIHGIIHRPAVKSDQKRAGVAIYHSFLGSKDQPRRMLVKLAEQLASAGAVALRIDFRGRGESEGDCIDVTPRRDLSDAFAALYHLAAQPDVDPARLGIVGLAWGGTIAALVAGRDRRVKATVLLSCLPMASDWCPPIREVDGHRVADLRGNLVGAQFFANLHTLDPLADLKQTHGGVLLVFGAADEQIAEPRVQTVCQALDASRVPHEVIAIPEADHEFARYEWEAAALGQTVGWLKRTLQLAA